jgi:hypothetical protein
MRLFVNYSHPNIYRLLLELLFIERNVHFHQSICTGYKYSEFHSMLSRLHQLPSLGRERLEMVYFIAMVNHKMLFDDHNPAAVAQLVHTECRTHTTDDHETPSPPYTGKCVTKAQPPGTNSTESFYGMNIIYISAPATLLLTSDCTTGLHTRCPKSHEIYFSPRSYWSERTGTGWVGGGSL